MKLLQWIRCPYDHSTLSQPAQAGHSMTCEQCGRDYPIHELIVCLMPDPLRRREMSDARDDAAWKDKQAEMAARDRQASQYDRYIAKYMNRVETAHLLNRVGASAGVILEIGAGTGRMTGNLLDRAEDVLALDFSFESLRRLSARLGRHPRLHLVQADASMLPIQSQSVDLVVSAQSLHHVPTEARIKAWAEISRVLRPTGRLVVTVYQYDLYRRLRTRLGLTYPDIEKQGYHLGTIYYNSFTRDELQRELESSLAVEQLRGIVTMPRELFSRLGSDATLVRAAAGAIGALDHGLTRSRLASSLGLLLLAEARPK
jgi:ubiquinone/menaquinone biosynthesis C-methylase UbiE/uncharacterized protein YbaR (Trm112 family)